MLPQDQVNRGEHRVGRKSGETGKLQDELPRGNAASDDITTSYGGIQPSRGKDNASQSLVQSLQAHDKKGKKKESSIPSTRFMIVASAKLG